MFSKLAHVGGRSARRVMVLVQSKRVAQRLTASTFRQNGLGVMPFLLPLQTSSIVGRSPTLARFCSSAAPSPSKDVLRARVLSLDDDDELGESTKTALKSYSVSRYMRFTSSTELKELGVPASDMYRLGKKIMLHTGLAWFYFMHGTLLTTCCSCCLLWLGLFVMAGDN